MAINICENCDYPSCKHCPHKAYTNAVQTVIGLSADERQINILVKALSTQSENESAKEGNKV